MDKELEKLAKRQAEEILEKLTERFQIIAPTLRWNRGTKNGRCSKKDWSVTVGPNCWRGWRDCLLHEFAHLVAFDQVGEHHHDRRFLPILVNVVTNYGGNVKNYAWHTEYRALWSLARKAGFTDQPHHRDPRRRK